MKGIPGVSASLSYCNGVINSWFSTLWKYLILEQKKDPLWEGDYHSKKRVAIEIFSPILVGD